MSEHNEYWALMYLHDWDPPKEGQEHKWEPGKNVFPEIHAIYDTWQEAEAVRKDMTNPKGYWVCRARPESEARLDKIQKTAEEILDKRMIEAGMIPFTEILKGSPIDRWKVQQGIETVDHFEEWLSRKQKEFLNMRMAYELGDKDEKDELYEWVFSHYAVFNDVLVNFKALRQKLEMKHAVTPFTKDDAKRELQKLIEEFPDNAESAKKDEFRRKWYVKEIFKISRGSANPNMIKEVVNDEFDK